MFVQWIEFFFFNDVVLQRHLNYGSEFSTLFSGSSFFLNFHDEHYLKTSNHYLLQPSSLQHLKSTLRKWLKYAVRGRWLSYLCINSIWLLFVSFLHLCSIQWKGQFCELSVRWCRDHGLGNEVRIWPSTWLLLDVFLSFWASVTVIDLRSVLTLNGDC